MNDADRALLERLEAWNGRIEGWGGAREFDDLANDLCAAIALFRDLTSVEVDTPLLARLTDLATSPTLHPSRAIDLRAAVALIQAQARQIARDRERSDNDARFAAKSANA